MPSPELQPQSPERAAPEVSPELYDKAKERLKESGERGVENGAEALEKAKHEALENAISVEAGGAEKARRGPSEGPAAAAAPPRKARLSTKDKNVAYKRHMAHVQAELPPAQRAFSKVIHNPAVEKTSEALGSTLFRPNAILASAFVGFILVLCVYVIAKYFGYPLSGFETIAAFGAGWLIGILYDYFRVMITGKK